MENSYLHLKKEENGQQSKQQGKYFFLVFILLLLVFFFLELLTIVQSTLVNPWTYFLSDISSFLVNIFDNNVIAYDNILRDSETGFAVSIAPGCNGVEAIIVLASAILAYPASIKNKLLGISLGFLAIQSLNVVRIISLFYLGQWNETLFNWAHSYIWQALIMLDVLIIYLFWLRTINQHNDSQKHE